MGENHDIEPIAVVGMSGRFPGAGSVAEFWENLCAGRESVSVFADDVLLANGVRPDELADPAYVRARAILEDAEWFDAGLFGFTPRDAALTDPQHRVFLECAWEAIEDAGYDPSRLPGSVGVFAGSSLNTYLLRHVFADPEASATFVRGFQVDGYPTLVANDKDYLATRVAYKLNLRGPAISVQTACSTSLVAVVQACQSLLAYQCDAALAGGVSITFPQERGYVYQEGAIASADGHCRAFDAAAAGTVFGAGCGVVLLRRLSDALEAGEAIYAVIRGGAVNNDGAEKVSYMAPSVGGQAEVVALAQAVAGVTADTIRYVEAHGTGTPLGDPIEVSALTQAFRTTTDRVHYCGLGTAKTNIGHLEAAAGVTGLIKTALALQARRIPPSLHFRTPNPQIDFARSPFFVVDRLMDWPEGSGPLRAGVSSFGVGGTNAHVVMEEAPPVLEEPREAGAEQLLVVSGHSPRALAGNASRLAAWFKAATGLAVCLGDAAETLRSGRKMFGRRLFVVAGSAAEAAEALAREAETAETRPETPAEVPPVAFLFPGQGAQSVNMAREVHDREPVFREAMARCCGGLRESLGFDLRDVLHPAPGSEDAAAARLEATALAQPALFTVEFAFASLWRSWGLEPVVVLGHSIGEYVAAVLAEVMTLEDALRLVAARGRLMQAMPAGSMLVVRLGEDDAAALLTGEISLAAVNAPKSCVLSGPTPAIERLQRDCESRNIACQRLRTSHAFHSPMMEPAALEFHRLVSTVRLREARLPVISTRTGHRVAPSTWASPEYWSGQIRDPVRFASAAGALLEMRPLLAIEAGPGQTLTKLAGQHPSRARGQVLVASAPPPGNPGGVRALLSALGQAWCAGVPIRWESVGNRGSARRVRLPTYAFDRQRYVLPSRAPAGGGQVRVPAIPEPGGTSARGGDDEGLEVPELIHRQLAMMTEQLTALGKWQTRNGNSS